MYFKTILGCQGSNAELIRACWTFGLLDGTIDITAFNHSEAEWSEAQLRFILIEILADASMAETDILKNFVGGITWTEMPLQEWRTNTKPEILKMLAAEGIEP